MTDRKKLIARVGQIRQHAAAGGEQPDRETDHQGERIRGLEARVAHLEQMLEGLQDSVHREFDRHDKQLEELQAQVHPASMGPALAENARQRGL